ncbi:hypothetical protein [Trinickia symbiotica]|uniref:hypothetical protein n=1 Tax=Trinickia symbiotica TaxID=863227 RepID=UPI003F7B0B20
MKRDHVPEVVDVAPVTTLGHHRIQAARRERRELPERLVDEGQIGIYPRGPLHCAQPWQACLGKHTLHCAAMHMQLARDGAAAPLLDMVIAQDLRLKLSLDGHGSLPFISVAVRISWKTRRRNGP